MHKDCYLRLVFALFLVFLFTTACTPNNSADSFADLGFTADEALSASGTEIRARLAQQSSRIVLDKADTDEARTLVLIAGDGNLWGPKSEAAQHDLRERVAAGTDPRGWVQVAMTSLNSDPERAIALMEQASAAGWPARDHYLDYLTVRDENSDEDARVQAFARLRAAWADGDPSAASPLLSVLDPDADASERILLLNEMIGNDNLAAIYLLGSIYITQEDKVGLGRELMARAAERHHPDAALALAKVLRASPDTTALAARHGERAGELGRPEGYIVAANIIGDPKNALFDKHKAKRLLLAAWDHDVSFAAVRLAALYEDPEVFDDLTQANLWAQRAADAGSPGGLVKLARYRYRDEDIEGAVQAATQASEAGSPTGSLLLAQILRLESSDPDAEAAAWVLAAQRGQTKAYPMAASLLYDGRNSVAQNHESAFRFAMAAEDQIPTLESINVLALSYHFGKGTAKDKKAAAPYWERAADAGSARARRILSNYYANGEIGPRDLERAVDWVRPLANSSDVNDREAFASALAAVHEVSGKKTDRIATAEAWLGAAKVADDSWRIAYTTNAAFVFLTAGEGTRAAQTIRKAAKYTGGESETRLRAACALPKILRRSLPSLDAALEKGFVDRMLTKDYYEVWPETRKRRYAEYLQALRSAHVLAKTSKTKLAATCLESLGSMAYDSKGAEDISHAAYREAARRALTKGDRSNAARLYQNAAGGSLASMPDIGISIIAGGKNYSHSATYAKVKPYCDALEEGESKGLYSIAAIQKEDYKPVRSVCLTERKRKRIWD